MLSENAKRELLSLARKTLQAYMADGVVAEYQPVNSELLVKQGAFVSLHNGPDLRGCIGQLFPDEELYLVVQSCALSAARKDMRFEPVTLGELPGLTIEISVLAPFRQIRSPDELEVGRHGLFIVRGEKRGLLLPQVAVEYEWDREEFLEYACRKAGLAGDAWHDALTEIHVFEAEVFSE
jgi:AmmeMemoRadiSam system protein A